MFRTALQLLIVGVAGLLLACGSNANPTAPDIDDLDVVATSAEMKGGKGKGGGKGGDDTDVTWSFADAVDHGVPDVDSSLRSTCPGSPPGSKLSNPSVEWKDDENPTVDGCATVTTTYGVRLTNDAYLIVATKKGDTKVTFQFQIQDIGGFDGIQYRTDRFVIDLPGFTGFTGTGFTMHVHATDVPIYRLKGHTGGPKVEMVGTINIGDIVYGG